jgi:hypothetical protein
VPALDGQNIVIGRVSAGMDVIAALARVPTYAPLPSARTWNNIAGSLGDGRAAKVRRGLCVVCWRVCSRC